MATTPTLANLLTAAMAGRDLISNPDEILRLVEQGATFYISSAKVCEIDATCSVPSLPEEITSIEAGKEAAILLSPNTDQFFNDLDLSAKNILREISNNTLMISRTTADDHGTQWIVLKSEDFGALVKGIDHFSTSIADKGLGSQMIAAVFKGTIENKDSYWICNYRTASYYPFVPIGKRERDFCAYRIS